MTEKIWQPKAERIEPPGVITLGLVSMGTQLCKRIWIILTKDERFAISKQHGTVNSSSVELATFFDSREEAENYLAQLEVRVAANCKLFPLYEWCMRLMARRSLRKAEDAGGQPAEGIPQ